jgi:SAM-dependent methyltransferase
LRRLRRPAWLGTVRRTTPLSDSWGRDRGQAIDRWYVERFLAAERAAITGRVLELLDDRYTRQFGTGVLHGDILDIDPANERATVVADLTTADEIPSDSYDCFILTQTLQYVYDVPAALRHVHRILRPGGTLLCTVPTVSRLEQGFLDTEYWRFSATACRRLGEEAFPGGEVDVHAHGNVLTCVAFLLGMAAEELKPAELEQDDPYFSMLVTCRARKSGP